MQEGGAYQRLRMSQALMRRRAVGAGVHRGPLGSWCCSLAWQEKKTTFNEASEVFLDVSVDSGENNRFYRNGWFAAKPPFPPPNNHRLVA